jgi:prephenate dehydratase
MKVGIQGGLGSACDEAAARLLSGIWEETLLHYLIDAERVLSALEDGSVDAAVAALESPVGVPVAETAEAIKRHPRVTVAAELRSEVRHCIMALPNCSEPIRRVASHLIPLEKHAEFLKARFPGYQPVVIDDTGLAAKMLAEGRLSPDAAVVALPRAAELFGLRVIERELPANDAYLTRFVLLRSTKEPGLAGSGGGI